jgi:flagellin-like protein
MFTHKSEKGITGLETAIILIAFVVVASERRFSPDSKKRRARSNHVAQSSPIRVTRDQLTPSTRCPLLYPTLSQASQST